MDLNTLVKLQIGEMATAKGLCYLRISLTKELSFERHGTFIATVYEYSDIWKIT